MAWTNYREIRTLIPSDTSSDSNTDINIESKIFVIASMSLAQSPSRE